VHIDVISVLHALSDLRATINVMTKETMLKLNFEGSLRNTSTMLHLADRSIVSPSRVVEDVMFSIYS